MASAPFDPIDATEARIATRVRAWADQAVVPVDASAVARAASAPRPLTRSAVSVLGLGPGRAFRLAIALATLALLAATLILVAGSQPSPSPFRPPWAPSPALVGDEVVPGVSRVTEDAAGRDLRGWPVDGIHRVAFAPDGGIWVLRVGELFRLGRDGAFPLPRGWNADLDAGPDGTLWAIFDGQVASFRGGAWTMGPAFAGAVRGLEVLPDGQVWASSDTALARLDGESWTTIPLPGDVEGIDAGETYPGVASWLDGGLAASADGSLWLRTASGDRLLRYDGTAWESIAFPTDFRVTLWAAGGNGVVWAYEDSGLWADRPRTSGGCGPSPKHRIARLADGSWTVMPERIPGISLDQCYVGYIAVAPDGRLWATAGDRIGVHDGAAWSDVFLQPHDEAWPLLEGEAVEDWNPQQSIAVAPDGSAWIWMRAGLLVIDPTSGR
jgi:hypothetical protein